MEPNPLTGISTGLNTSSEDVPFFQTKNWTGIHCLKSLGRCAVCLDCHKYRRERSTGGYEALFARAYSELENLRLPYLKFRVLNLCEEVN